ncbi:MAG: AzlD domain-containing protein [Bifidobacteriaceae bacterium]|jgi:phosphatidylglycerophosphate synthase|nr:AzlD domain-containing protein [Bifidobacteriaceae bacterium]
MTGLWVTVLAGTGACLGLKVLGTYVPRTWLEKAKVARLMGLVTVALLAALMAVQAAGDGQGLRLDARLAALAVAAIALWRRLPFIVVVILAAATAAGLRALGIG